MSNQEEQQRNLDKLSDYAEGDGRVDEAKASQATEALFTQESGQRAEEQERLQRLAAVQVNAADIELLRREMEIDDEAKAKQLLQESNGDIVAALRRLVAPV